MGMAIVCSPYTKRKQGNRGFLDNLGGWLDPDYDGLESYNEAVNQWESYNRSGSQEALTEVDVQSQMLTTRPPGFLERQQRKDIPKHSITLVLS